MPKCVVYHPESNQYLTPRRGPGYQARSGWAGRIGDAKVFNTKGAAVNSANHNGREGYEVREIEYQLGDPL